MNKIRLCPTGKFTYLTAELAEEALAHYRAIPWNRHRKRRPPVAKYHCVEGGFGHFHLTGMHPMTYARQRARQRAERVDV